MSQSEIDPDDSMQIDARVAETEEQHAAIRREVEDYLCNISHVRPEAPDPRSYFEEPFQYTHNSACLANTIDQENNTALICAVKAGSDRAFYALLAGKDPGYVNFQNSKGVTALNIASQRGYVHYVNELMSAGRADVNIPNTSGSTSLIQASHFGHANVVQLLLAFNAAVDRPNLKGTTALMRAAQEGHQEVVDALLHCGADVNKRNNERMNALMLASQRGHATIVKMLIKHGADIDCQTVQGSTALMLACKRQHEAVVAVLLTAGAEIFVTDSRGRTARDTAQKRSNKSIIDMLQSSYQVRLMQTEARAIRSHLLVNLYELSLQKRAAPVADIKPTLLDNSNQILGRVFDLPFSLFQNIVRYIPWPRMWDHVLPMLHRRCNIDANEAIRGALTVVDEILTDLQISTDANQENHLMKAVVDGRIAATLKNRHKIPCDLCEVILAWQDVQSVLSRMQAGVTFASQVADRTVKDAARLMHWYRSGTDDHLDMGEDDGDEGEQMDLPLFGPPEEQLAIMDVEEPPPVPLPLLQHQQQLPIGQLEQPAHIHHASVLPEALSVHVPSLPPQPPQQHPPLNPGELQGPSSPLSNYDQAAAAAASGSLLMAGDSSACSQEQAAGQHAQAPSTSPPLTLAQILRLNESRTSAAGGPLLHAGPSTQHNQAARAPLHGPLAPPFAVPPLALPSPSLSSSARENWQAEEAK